MVGCWRSDQHDSTNNSADHVSRPSFLGIDDAKPAPIGCRTCAMPRFSEFQEYENVSLIPSNPTSPRVSQVCKGMLLKRSCRGYLLSEVVMRIQPRWIKMKVSSRSFGILSRLIKVGLEMKCHALLHLETEPYKHYCNQNVFSKSCLIKFHCQSRPALRCTERVTSFCIRVL